MATSAFLSQEELCHHRLQSRILVTMWSILSDKYDSIQNCTWGYPRTLNTQVQIGNKHLFPVVQDRKALHSFTDPKKLHYLCLLSRALQPGFLLPSQLDVCLGLVWIFWDFSFLALIFLFCRLSVVKGCGWPVWSWYWNHQQHHLVVSAWKWEKVRSSARIWRNPQFRFLPWKTILGDMETHGVLG